jgi:hypothetical protein
MFLTGPLPWHLMLVEDMRQGLSFMLKLIFMPVGVIGAYHRPLRVDDVSL